MANTLVFIDCRVNDYQALIDTLSGDAKWFLLGDSESGIEQIRVAVAGRSDLAAIHIVSHGSEGTLYLGNDILDSSTVGAHATALAEIGGALSNTGDILLYGCDVAQGEAGQSFIAALSLATGADVAASSGLTGSANVGGDWLLEQSTGPIEVDSLSWTDFAGTLSANTAPSYSGTLGGTITFVEGGSPVLMDSNVQVFDAELSALNGGLGNYDRAWLYLSAFGGATGGTTAHDQYSGANIVAGQYFGNVIVSGTTVGAYNWGDGILTVLFNANATQSLVNQTMQSISYVNTNQNPASSTTVYWTFFDGNTGAQGTGDDMSGGGSVTVNITAVNDSPALEYNHGLTLNEGATGTIGFTQINEGDPDDSGSGLTYTITSAPTHGRQRQRTDLHHHQCADPWRAVEGRQQQYCARQRRSAHGGWQLRRQLQRGALHPRRQRDDERQLRLQPRRRRRERLGTLHRQLRHQHQRHQRRPHLQRHGGGHGGVHRRRDTGGAGQ
ncbi:MAG: DUF4347 domain-containing protein [Rhodocyclales bacterium]|nr:DUF4347 domain-containing protein [Rhodocyclales bacterium]